MPSGKVKVEKRDVEPTVVLMEAMDRTETCRVVHVPWDLESDLLRQTRAAIAS